MAAGAQRFFGSKVQSAAFAKQGFSPTVLVWAYGTPASDYRERFDKDYWSEVQRHVRPSCLSLRAASVFCKRGMVPPRPNVCAAHTLLVAFFRDLTPRTRRKAPENTEDSSDSGLKPKESIWSA